MIEVTAGMAVAVEQGTAHADSVWLLVTDGPIVLGTTALQFDWVGRRGLAPLVSPAFTGNPTAPTPPRFDKDTSLATTEFVKESGLCFAGTNAASSTSPLGVAAVNNLTYCSGAGGYTLTLPLSSLARDGDTITLAGSTTNGFTVVPQGGDLLYGAGGTPVASIFVGPTDVLCIERQSLGIWMAFGGSAQLKHASSFWALLAANGYQKLPSGLIIQWATNTQVGESISVSLPIAFPNACLFATVNTRTDNGAAVVSIKSTTDLVGSALVGGTNATGTNTYDWLAIGF